jgi:hypothetical protein
MICPNCKNTKWEKFNLGGIIIDKCPNCKGLWFDGGELYQAIEKGVYYSSKIDSEKQIVNSPEIAKKCPRCKAAMKRIRRENVYIDICADCKGIWCDEGEFRELSVIMNEKGLI